MMRHISIFLLFYFSITISVSQSVPVNEESFVSIGGIEQWVTIHGNDKSKPGILFLHGGPGSVASPYAETIYGKWKNDFVLVNWDQRGAGRTFGKNAPDNVDEDYWLENPLSLDQMVSDGIEVAEYILKHLNKKKLILVGTSWGSILGARMALQRPELFHLYLGHAQFVNFANNLKSSYDIVYKLATNKQDTAAIDKLKALGVPPYKDARSLGQLLRIVKQYEAINSTPAPDGWWKPAPEYDNERDNGDRYNGDDYSFLYFAGHEKLGIKSMAADVDFKTTGLVFKLPVCFIQGEQDILTSASVSKPWFEMIKAPKKEYIVVPKAAHGYNQSVIDKQFEVLNKWVGN